MGKGDKRTKRGKIFKGSYGKTRPHDPDKKKSDAAPKQRPQRAPGSR
jgi:30S ribosomal protein S31